MLYQPTLSGINVLEPTKQTRSVLLFGLSGALSVDQLQVMAGYQVLESCFVWYEPLELRVPVIELLRPPEAFRAYLALRGYPLSRQCQTLIWKTVLETRAQIELWLSAIEERREDSNSHYNALSPCGAEYATH